MVYQNTLILVLEGEVTNEVINRIYWNWFESNLTSDLINIVWRKQLILFEENNWWIETNSQILAKYQIFHRIRSDGDLLDEVKVRACA